ncbi:hypothetical protein D3C80_1678440 [compost metagenome]
MVLNHVFFSKIMSKYIQSFTAKRIWYLRLHFIQHTSSIANITFNLFITRINLNPGPIAVNNIRKNIPGSYCGNFAIKFRTFIQEL